MDAVRRDDVGRQVVRVSVTTATPDMRRPPYPVESARSIGPWRTLVTGATGSSARMWRGAAERGDDCASTSGARLAATTSWPSTCEAVDAPTSSTGRACAAHARASTASSTSPGSTNLRAAPARLLRVERRRHARPCWRRPTRGGGARRPHVVGRRHRPGAARVDAPTSACRSPPGAAAIPYARAKREAEVEALRLAARGLPVVIVNPAHVFGRGRRQALLDRARAPLPARRMPAYVDGALNVVDVEDVARGQLLADERGVPGERYILGNRNFTLERLFADLGAAVGVEPPALKLPLPAALALARAAARAARAPAGDRRRGPRRGAVVGVPLQQGAARAGLDARPPRGHLQETIDWYREREPATCGCRAPGQPLALRLAGQRGDAGGVSAGSCPDPVVAVPLPHADERAVPVRPRRARAAPPRVERRRGAGAAAQGRARRGRAR